MKNRYGFTLVEVLAVIVIISILSVLVIPNVTQYVAEGKDEFNKSLKHTLILAGKNFYADNKVRIPKKVGKITDFVTASELASKNYLTGTFVDSDKNECTSKSYVVAVNDIYAVNYHACLTCGDKNYTSDDEYCKNQFRDDGSSDPGSGDDGSKTDISCKVETKSTDSGASVTVTSSSTKKITKLVYSNNATKKVSDNLLSDSEFGNSINKNVSISEFGNFNIYVISEDGKRSDCGGAVITNSYSPNFKADMYLVDKSSYEAHKDSGYTSSELKSMTKYDGKSWKDGYVYVKFNYKSMNFSSVKLDDNDLSNKYAWFIAEGNKSYKVTTTDKDGSTNNYTLTTMLDRTAPTITFTRTAANSYGWNNSAVNTSTTPSDKESGVEGIYYSTNGSSWEKVTSGNAVFTKNYAKANTNQAIYVKAKDNVGHFSNVQSSSILIDITPPVMYKHCLYNVANKRWYFRYYFSDSGGSGYNGYRWGYCYNTCPKCPSSYMCSYKSADSKASADSWHSGSYKETSYQIAPTSGSKTIGAKTRLYFRDRAGNVGTGTYTDTWNYSGGSSPGRC